MTLRQLLTDGITIYDNESVQLINGKLTKVNKSFARQFPIDAKFDDDDVSVVWDIEEDELIVFHEQHAEMEITDHLMDVVTTK